MTHPTDAQLVEALHAALKPPGWEWPDIEPWIRLAAQRLEAREVSEAWKEAAIAWACCASLHREWANGKDALYWQRQADFLRHEEKARAALEAMGEGYKP